MKRLVFLTLLAVLLGFSTLAHADLINNGGGLIYDTSLNITWYDYNPGRLRSDQVMSWVQNLSVTVNGVSVTGWRLPQTLPVNGSAYNYNLSYNGSTDYGYGITSPNSEMAYLYYVELGNKALYDTSGVYQSGAGLVKTGFFATLVSSTYWSGTGSPRYSNYAWAFQFGDGGQADYLVYTPGDETANYLYALAVHSGNVGAPVPIPSAILLLGPGLAGLIFIRRRLGG